MEYPELDGIVEVKRNGGERWTTALFYRNGNQPVFAQFGSEINDVTEWRKKKRQNNDNFVQFNEIFG